MVILGVLLLPSLTVDNDRTIGFLKCPFRPKDGGKGLGSGQQVRDVGDLEENEELYKDELAWGGGCCGCL